MTRRRHATVLAASLLAMISLSVSAQRTARKVFISAVDAAGAPVLTCGSRLTAVPIRFSTPRSSLGVTREGVRLEMSPRRTF